MKFPKITFMFTLGLIMTLTFACGDDDGDDGGNMPADCSDTRSYAMDIVPILNETCAIPNCHVGGNAIPDYRTFDGLKETVAGGLLRSQIETGTMPPEDTAGPLELTEAQLETFLCWIDDGALDN